MNLAIDLSLFVDFGTALLIGALIGIEREKRKSTDKGQDIAGLRNFTIIALIGSIAGWLDLTLDMPWILPGVPPTGRRVELAVVAVVEFRDGKIASEHIYWDQASVLVQVGLLDPSRLPIAGIDVARKALDPKRPSNALIRARSPI